MPAATRLNDNSTGHPHCYPARPVIQGSPNVFCNGRNSIRVGDAWAVHGACPDHSPHPKAEMTGGEKEHKLTVQEMPSHTHTGTSENAGNHNHGGTTSAAGEHYHGSWGEAYPDPPLGIYAGPGYQGSNGGRDYDNYLYKTTTNGAHSHTLTTGNAGTHSHTLKIDSSGEGKPHNNMPPFFTAYVWVRIG